MPSCASATRSEGSHLRADHNHAVAIVVIGRNEGERLKRCLDSLAAGAHTVVYVDSGSTDRSLERARAAGARVVELDLSLPFTAARARNVGFEHMMEVAPRTEFVQFVDGDCTLHVGWIDTAVRALREQRDVAVVCGRRRERFPEASVYNRLCDVEWDTPVGIARACGGDALMRVEAFRRVGGYDPAMIAGEEPDLCLRLARQGHRVLRVDAEMTLHDAAMTHWRQWWQRAVRTGHTTAELLAKYGPAPEHRRARRALSDVFWAVALPIAWLACAAWTVASASFIPIAAASMALALAYAFLLARIQRRCRRAGRSRADARAYSVSCALAKWPETWGMLVYVARRASGRTARWIEYKDDPREADTAARRLDAAPGEALPRRG